MTVSVVIPVRDRRELIGRAVASVLAQDRAPDQVVVVDDGSDDGSGDVAASFGGPVRVLRTDGIGRSAARNLGMEATSSTWVAFLDSDDEWLPGALARHLERLTERPDAALSAGHVRLVDAAGNELASPTAELRSIVERLAAEPAPLRALTRRPGIYTSAIVVRRSAVVAVGGFDVAIDGNEDWDLWLRLAAEHPVAVVPWPPVTRYLVHEGNTSTSAMATATLVVAAKHLQRSTDPVTTSWLHLHKARAHATLGDLRQARTELLAAFRCSGRAAVAEGGLRLALAVAGRSILPAGR